MAKSTATQRSHKGLGTAVALSVAAGLAGAALLYLRRKGVSPKQAGVEVKKGAKKATAILSGESKAAYHEVRDEVIAQLAMSNKKITRPMVLATIKQVTETLKKHTHMTKQQMEVLRTELTNEWMDLTTAATKRS